MMNTRGRKTNTRKRTNTRNIATKTSLLPSVASVDTGLVISVTLLSVIPVFYLILLLYHHDVF